MAKKKYLKFYYECMVSGLIPESRLDGYDNGLCGNLGKEAMSPFVPTMEDCNDYHVVGYGYWARDHENISSLSFGPTRQNIVLFLAAMNNEL